ncbi:hypothetical protein LXL04_028508 [Taraxacum kok-saghyz]
MDSLVEDKENVPPVSVHVTNQKPILVNSKNVAANPLSEINISSFRPLDLDFGTLFDLNLLAAFEQAVLEVKAQESERRNRILQNIEDYLDHEQEPEPPLKSLKLEEIPNPL